MDSVRKPYVGPVVLADVPEESRAITEETFGPTLTVTRVPDLEEGVRLANGGRYGLGGTVFAGNRKRAMEAARALRSGMTSINSVIAFASVIRGSAGFMVPTGCASSPTRRRSPGSGCAR
jgi:acyl-CoA reductase-like NAD-dependent aldehyde dehydrogenase